MQHDLIERLDRGGLEEMRGLLADVLVRCAVKAVAANLPAAGQIPVDRIRRRRSGQVVEERGVEDRDVRQVRKHAAGDWMPRTAGGLCSGASGGELLQRGDQRIVDEGRPVQVLAAVNHPVPDRDQPSPSKSSPASRNNSNAVRSAAS